jgi:hypothetical protein
LLRFGEIVSAVAAGTVISMMLDYVFGLAFVAAMGTSFGLLVAFVLAILVASLVVGYVFAEQIQESRLGSIGRIAALGGVVVMFTVMISFAANGYYGLWAGDYLRSNFSTGSWTTMDWFIYGQMVLITEVVIHLVLALAMKFIGLYVGSMRKVSSKEE